MTDKNLAIARVVADVATELNSISPQVALAWLRQHQRGVIPIVGARTEQQLIDNLACLNVVLSVEQLAKLDAVSAIVLGFPHDFLAGENIQNMLFAGTQSMIR